MTFSIKDQSLLIPGSKDNPYTVAIFDNAKWLIVCRTFCEPSVLSLKDYISRGASVLTVLNRKGLRKTIELKDCATSDSRNSIRVQDAICLFEKSTDKNSEDDNFRNMKVATSTKSIPDRSQEIGPSK